MLNPSVRIKYILGIGKGVNWLFLIKDLFYAFSWSISTFVCFVTLKIGEEPTNAADRIGA